MREIHSRIAVLAIFCILVAGCAQKMGLHGQVNSLSESMAQIADQESPSDSRPDRMLIWKAFLTVEIWDIAEAVSKTETIVEQLNGYVEHKSDSGEESASLRLRVPVAKLKNAVGAIESLGEVTYRTVSGEDVTEQYIDIEARLKNKIELRDRLRQLLQKATEVKDIITIETELSRVQADIDAMQGKIKSLKGQVDYSTIEANFRRKTVLGPLGYVFKGIWWGIEKLFVIRD